MEEAVSQHALHRSLLSGCYWRSLSQGRFTWWPTTADARVPLSARELLIVLWNGDPEGAHMATDWRRMA